MLNIFLTVMTKRILMISHLPYQALQKAQADNNQKKIDEATLKVDKSMELFTRLTKILLDNVTITIDEINTAEVDASSEQRSSCINKIKHAIMNSLLGVLFTVF